MIGYLVRGSSHQRTRILNAIAGCYKSFALLIFMDPTKIHCQAPIKRKNMMRMSGHLVKFSIYFPLHFGCMSQNPNQIKLSD